MLQIPTSTVAAELRRVEKRDVELFAGLANGEVHIDFIKNLCLNLVMTLLIHRAKTGKEKVVLWFLHLLFWCLIVAAVRIIFGI